MKSRSVSSSTLRILLLATVALFAMSSPGAAEEDPGRELVDRAIEAMGGQAYLDVSSASSTGRYFWFRKGRKAFAKYRDWSIYEPVVKSRFELGEGDRQLVRIHNLETGKGWVKDGKYSVEEIPEEEMERFRRAVKTDLDILLRSRLDEEGLNLYYYGPDDIAGAGEFEAVEFLDSTNNSIVVFFDRDSHLPVKTETHRTDDVGVRHKEEREYSNWHVIDGVKTPLRSDLYVDEELSSQQFIEELEYNPVVPPGLFDKPVLEED